MADRLAVEILATSGFSDNLPVDIERVAECLGMTFQGNDDLRTEGRVVHTRTGPIIEYNTKRPPARQRFTKAHELVHAWMDRPNLSALSVATRAAFRAEEEMCDTVGAALLLPHRWMQGKAARARMPEHQTMEHLGMWAKEARVSREVAIIRLRDVFEWPKILMTWEKRDRWLYTGECGVRPWEFGQLRPEANIATDHLPQAASHKGGAVLCELGVTVGCVLEVLRAELAVDGPAGYALIDSPFRRSRRPHRLGERHEGVRSDPAWLQTA